MEELQLRTNEHGQHIVDVWHDDSVLYTTDPYDTAEAAFEAAQTWFHWFNAVPHRRAESIYYILVVPETWPGPPPGAHPYSGLHFKIGRTNDVLRRVQNLKTGTSGDLIIHALELGNAQIERERQERFKADRRQGEWFACSPDLCQHVMETWRRNKALPPEHQRKLLELVDRIRAYRMMRDALGSAPDMVNPSINEKWQGKVFLDLVYSRLVRGGR